MAGDTDINSLPAMLMPRKTKNLLSRMLNSPKIIPSDGPDKLPRDWRGFAHLANIPAHMATSFHQCNDKTAKVLDIWLQDGTATVGKLLEFMQRIDRYDVHDDILNDLLGYVESGEIDLKQPYKPCGPVAINAGIAQPAEEDYDVITVDDSVGYEHQYDAFVLYADEDKDFVDELRDKLGERFQICTKEKLRPGHATQYAPIAHLISKRCLCIILVYSPDFLRSPANKFYTDYAQAVTIESRGKAIKVNIIPIMYRECVLPLHLMYYHKLYYKKEGPAIYDFWVKLRQTLDHHRMVPRLNGASASASHSGLKIVELTNSNGVSNGFSEAHLFLSPVQKTQSISMDELDSLKISSSRSCDDLSLSNLSQISDTSVKKKKKRMGPIKRIIGKWGKNKEKVLASTSAV